MGKKHVFLLDDEPKVREVVRETLEKAAIKVSCFANPSKCLAKLQSKKCDLLITDLRMPRMDGVQLLAKVKTYDFGQSRAELTELADTIRKAYGNAGEMKKIEAALVGVLESDAKYAGKQWVCRQLSIVGSDACVPALAKMLTDDELNTTISVGRNAMPAFGGVLEADEIASLIAFLRDAQG